jgi:hypothetical protein
MRATLKSIHGKAFRNDAWKSPAFLMTPERSVSLGGHVHLDVWFDSPDNARPTVEALDRFNAGLVHLDILPKAQALQRATHSGYGRPGDVRWEHRRLEYRSMCSWLFSRKTALLALTGAKFATLAPEEVPVIESTAALRRFIEKFKGKDSDADWMLNRGYFTRSLEARPDTDIKTSWRLEEAA